MRSTHCWLLGFGLAVLVGASAALSDHLSDLDWAVSGAEESPSWLPDIVASEPAEAGPPVLVLLVESQGQLERLRRSLGARRLLADSRRVVAIEGLIATSNLEYVSDPLNALGWSDRPLEIVTRKRPQAEAHGGAPAGPGPNPDLIRELSKKPTLNRAEAMLLLEHL